MTQNSDQKQLSIGSFVRYKIKNKLGVVGELTFNGARCWYHSGGTREMSPYEIIERFSYEDVLNSTFSNEYAKASLIERHFRVHEGGDVSDLIDDKDIRPSIKISLRHQEDINNVRE